VVGASSLPVVWLAARATRPMAQMLRALASTVASYREGDFSLSLVADRSDELGELMTAHNELSAALRVQRTHLVQRELLLDTVMQNSPVALVLVDAHKRIAYANIAARHLLSEGRSLNGLRFGDVLSRAPPALRGAAAVQGDSLFSADIEGVEETFHLSQRAFILQGQTFRLYLLKRLTRELSRQEVSTWKKLIRVLSHELNNSLGPLSSLDFAVRVCGHRRTRRAPASLRQRLCGLCQIAGAPPRTHRMGGVRGRSCPAAGVCQRGAPARAGGLVRSGAGRTGVDQSTEERARGRGR
jgi:PAS domain-containing protein